MQFGRNLFIYFFFILFLIVYLSLVVFFFFFFFFGGGGASCYGKCIHIYPYILAVLSSQILGLWGGGGGELQENPQTYEWKIIFQKILHIKISDLLHFWERILEYENYFCNMLIIYLHFVIIHAMLQVKWNRIKNASKRKSSLFPWRVTRWDCFALL